ncbi:hypothetical protein M9Y10_041571 [Tritrichomonas musculus]|uniref:Rab-GAP TBC domain-containing protein n=1 Tax=Tritrichomonas musculus TaxID=1915356 RepID=A0ABR2K5B4_9EUKA
MDRKNDILAIFHEVKTDILGQSALNGTFVVANQMGELTFWWRSYRKLNKNDKEKPHEIKLYISNIQKIMVNYQENDCYILITTSSPSTMHQFTFPPSSSYQLMQFTQIIAIKQQMNDTNSIEEAMDFISATYYGSSTQKRLIDLKNENGRLEFPSFLSTTEFMQQNNDIEAMQVNDTFFSSNFDVNPDNIVKNPIQLSDLKSFPDAKSLKNVVRDRGLSTDIRHVIWPILCNILPFEESKWKEMLKVRTEEYLSIRNQWESFSKLQIKNFTLVRESFITIRVDVKRTHPQESVVSVENWNVMLTNILRSFSLWNLNVRYTQGLNDLAVNFMGIFLPQIAKGELTADEAEALSFWCFSSFIETIESGITAENLMIAQTKEVKIIGQIINKFHPICFEWLRTHNLSDLLFIISSLMLAYSRSFSFNDIFRIWESIICSKSPPDFLRFFTASLIIHCFPSIMMQNECSLGRIIQSIDKMFLKQNVGSVIGVAIAMMDKSDISPNNKKEEKIIDPEINEFFTLDTSTAFIYRDSGNLFI